ncbi:MAG: histidine phosphatase family protein [Hormoscilla sp. SP12CHS1]|nr:histidine phosphatase family protein [Hormoscilla sp. SP12CHS1]
MKEKHRSQTIYLVRHGLRQDHEDYGVEGARKREEWDPSLFARGHRQAEELAGAIQNSRIQHIFCSPFLRCLQTAAPFAEKTGLPIKVETGLMVEFTSMPRVGFLQGDFPVEADYKSLSYPKFPESLDESLHRAGSVTVKLANMYEGDLLIVGHEYTVIAGTRALLDRSPSALPLGCPPTGLFQLSRNPEGDRGWEMVKNADISHLSEAFKGMEPPEIKLWLGYHGLRSLDDLK